MSDYLTAEQYEYARKTGDWESGKVLTHGQALNDNQKIVLDYLKNNTATAPFSAVFNLLTKRESEWHNLSEISSSSYELDRKQQFQVLAAFAEWGMEQEEAE
ncbi:TPA: hypothetical protein QFM04_000549 [Enterococcus faecium]